ncbi:15-cis-phytoene desaturase [mine drainage metagenome]|uniref:15-cis-phytoene desaturase n=1 Tax=mine drainage metagenome TaxID=410659 RepID=A0A1J5SG63_9ZZZZ
MSAKAQVAVIGAGYAGMAAAVELAAAGIPADVFEASRVLGGRARALELDGITIDNGQHLLVGAYRETLRLIDRVHPGGCNDLLLRLPLTLVTPGHLSLRAPPLPAPLHLAAALLFARGLTIADKRAALRLMRNLKRSRYRLGSDISVAELLAAHHQPTDLCRLLWQPLCVAALNTPVDTASARVFVNVLRDSLGGLRAASDLLLPRVDLGTLFPAAAERFLLDRGGRVLRSTAIKRIAQQANGYRLDGAGQQFGPYRQAIVAVAPQHLKALIAPLPGLDELRLQVGSLAYEPIVTCYLAYPAGARLAAPMLGHPDGLTQWLFDRGQLNGPAGLFAAVISAHGRHQELSNDELAAAIHAEISTLVPDLPSPLWSRVITEKRATFACTPDLVRPQTQTPLPGLLLAGDYVACDYPATLEAAVSSGVAAANSVIASAARQS